MYLYELQLDPNVTSQASQEFSGFLSPILPTGADIRNFAFTIWLFNIAMVKIPKINGGF